MTDQPIEKRRKIAIFIADLTGGGAEKNMVNLANAFTSFGWQVDMVLTRNKGDYFDQLSEGIRVVDLGSKKTLFSVGKLARYLKSEQPAALLSALDSPNIVAAVAKRVSGAKLPVSISIRNTLSVEYQSAGASSKVVAFLARKFFPWADNILAVSQGVADDAEKFLGLPKGRVQALMNPVVTPDLLRKIQEPLDHPWFKPDQPPVILGVGRLSYQKNFPMLIEAFGLVRDKVDARLMILGEGDDRPALEAQIKSAGLEASISLPGFAKNPYSYLREARVFALSSNFEGLPTVLIESLGAGTPVVSTDCPSGPQEILQGGKYGPIVPVGDAKAFAEALISELSHPKVKPPKEAWEPFERDFVAKRYLDVMLRNVA